MNVEEGAVPVKVLVVEDDEGVGRFLHQVISEEGWEANWEEDGAVALRHLQDESYDLVLLDVMLPGKDGVEVCRELRARGNNVPVLMITARDALEDKIAGLDAGADDYLIKPFDPRIISLKVNNLIRLRDDMKERYSRVVIAESETGNNIARDVNEAFISKLRVLLMENISDPNFGVNELAMRIGMSTSVLYRKMRSLTGMTINEFVKTIRFHEAKKLLESGVYQVGEVALLIGFEDAKYFSREFTKVFGKNPKEIKRRGAG